MRKWTIKLTIVFLFIILTPIKVYASSNGFIDELFSQFETAQINELSSVIGKSGTDIDFRDLLQQALSGDTSVSPQAILLYVPGLLFKEVGDLLHVMRTMLIVTILSALFKALSSSFSRKEVAEIGFYANFIIVIALVLSSFYTCVNIMQDLANDLCLIMEAALPVMTSLMVMGGQLQGAYTFTPIILFMLNFITRAIRDYLTPCILAGSALCVINFIAPEERLTKLSDFVRKALSVILKAVAGLFIALLSLQGIAAPALNNTIMKSAKFAVNAVPVVGSTLAQAAEAMISMTAALKSGFLVAIVIVIVLLSAIPLIKIAAFIFVYKLTAAIIQPICDERIVKAIDGVGSYAAITLGAAGLVAAMVIFSTIVSLA